MARLVVISPDVPTSVHELNEGWTTIGRGDGNTYQVAAPSISGRHCEVRVDGRELVVRDLLSTNGTFVGGHKVSEARVKAGETLRLGDVEFRFESGEVLHLPSRPAASRPSAGRSADDTSVMKAHAGPVPATAGEANDAEKRFHVLFVDDSMAFLELFGGLCSAYSGESWKIHKATSADSALALEVPEKNAVYELDGVEPARSPIPSEATEYPHP